MVTSQRRGTQCVPAFPPKEPALGPCSPHSHWSSLSRHLVSQGPVFVLGQARTAQWGMVFLFLSHCEQRGQVWVRFQAVPQSTPTAHRPLRPAQHFLGWGGTRD